MSSLRRLLPFLKPLAPTLALAYACMVVLGITTAFYAFLAGPALKFVFSGELGDILRSSGGELRAVWRWLPADWLATLEQLDRSAALFVMPVLIVVTALLKGLAHTAQFYLIGRISQEVLRRLRATAFGAMLRQSAAFFNRRAHGDLLSRLTNDANLVEQTFFYGIAPLLREPLAVIFLLAFCVATDPLLALITFLVVPIAVLPLARFARWLKRVSRRGQDYQGKINAVTYEALAGIRVVQAFTAEADEEQKLDRAASDYFGQMLRSYFIRAVRTPTMEFLGAVSLAALLALMGYWVQSSHADPAHFISFFVAVVMMYDPLKKLGNVTDYLAHGAAAADRIFEVIDLEPEIRDRPGAVTLPPFADCIRFEAVRFAYGEAPILTDIDLELPLGHVVALVGPSGAGKTTLAHLLPRFFDVTAGRLVIDRHDVREVTLASLRRQVSVVSQDTFLFNCSVAQNIAYGTPQATHAEIRAAARAAHADEFIEALERGYDTPIGERGIRLSGGQRQRLAIARALLRDAPILILDEATSALDLESERFVQRALETLMRGRTSLVIAHRLSTVRRANLIAVLKDGCIVERGRHNELLQRNGEYARLYAMQFADAETAPEVVGLGDQT